MLARRLRIALALGIAIATLAGCATRRPAGGSTSKPAAGAPLRVGVAPNSPPFAFRQEGGLVGLEIDFAQELTRALGRPLELRSMEWDDLIRGLGENQIDIIMSGMTITRARQVRVAFSDPYLISALIAVVRRGEAPAYPTAQSVLDTRGSIGVVANTTGERLVRERAPLASISVYQTIRAAIEELRQRRVDAVVHDAAVILSFVSANEAELAPVLHPFDREPLGWGVRHQDDALRTAVNALLARWRTDGTRERILSRWIPYWSRLETEAATQQP